MICSSSATSPYSCQTRREPGLSIFLVVNLDQFSGEAPDSKLRAGTFEPTEAIKLVPVNPACPDDRALRISATLDIK